MRSARSGGRRALANGGPEVAVAKRRLPYHGGALVLLQDAPTLLAVPPLMVHPSLKPRPSWRGFSFGLGKEWHRRSGDNRSAAPSQRTAGLGLPQSANRRSRSLVLVSAGRA